MAISVVAATQVKGYPTSSLAVNKPTGTAENDLLVLHVVATGGASALTGIPSGFSNIAGSPFVVNAGTTVRAWVLTKTATASEPETYTVDINTSNVLLLGMVALRDSVSVPVIGAIASTLQTELVTTFVAPSVTVGEDSSIWLTLFATAHGEDPGINLTLPSGHTAQVNQEQYNGESASHVGRVNTKAANAGATGTASAECDFEGVGVLLSLSVETPGSTDRRGEIAWAEFEVPTAPRRGEIAWAEFEVPTAPRRSQIAWAEFEVPSVVSADRRGEIAWAEFEVPTAPRRGQIAWAEFEVPALAPRRGLIAWAELEVPNAARRAIISWAELAIVGETSWTLPFEQDGVVVVNTATGEIIPTSQVGAVLTTTGGAGDLTEVEVTIGVPFEFLVELSRFYPRTRRGNDTDVADVTADLRVSYLTLFVREDSAGLEAEVAYSDGRTSYTYSAPVGATEWRIPILGSNKKVSVTITHNGHLSGGITGYEWEGSLTMRTRRF